MTGLVSRAPELAAKQLELLVEAFPDQSPSSLWVDDEGHLKLGVSQEPGWDSAERDNKKKCRNADPNS